MATKIKVIDKATHASAMVDGREITLSAQSIVELPIAHSQVKSLARKGGDLVITTVDGQTIVVHGYFAKGQAGHSDLVFLDGASVNIDGTDAAAAASSSSAYLADLSSLDAHDGVIELAEGDSSGIFSFYSSDSQLADAGDSSDSDAIASTVAADAQDAYPATAGADTSADAAAAPATAGAASANGGGEMSPWLPIPLALAGFALALNSSSGGSGGGRTAPVPPTISSVTQNPDGTLNVTGRGTPGDTITITFPSGATATGTAGSDGSYSINSPGVEGSGNVSATDTDPRTGETSGGESYPGGYQDRNPPLPPVNKGVVHNPDGSITVNGSAEPGSNVKVVFPDGTSATQTVGSDGQYSIPSAGPQPGGNISINATDPAGNISGSTIVPYAPQPPDAPSITAITPNQDDGSITVTGKGQPGAAVHVTFPDGKTVDGTVGSDGTYSIKSAPGQTTGDVSVSVSDTGGTSASTGQHYTDGTAPSAPIYITATHDSTTGIVTVSGTAEVNSIVKIVFPDGTSASAVVGADGKYSIPSAGPQPSGTITITATDQAGHTSIDTTAQWTGVPPAAPTIAGITVNPDGSITITGTAEPNSTITATFSDPSSAVTTADAQGQFTISSGPGQTSEKISITATDAGGTSPVTTTDYTDTTKPVAPTQPTVTTNADGSLTVSGTGEPNSTIKVVYPDGSSSVFAVGADGKYSVSSAAGKAQQAGDVTVTDTDQANNTSDATSVHYNPQVPQPKISGITANPDGSITVTGSSEVGGTVTVTFPDHSSKTFVVGSDGLYTVQSAPGQTTGSVAVTNTNDKGTSPALTQTYNDSTPPLAPTLNPVILTNADGSIIVSGTAEPNSTVKVTFPDGTSAVYTVGANGLFSVTSAANERGGPVSATATDQANHTGPAATEQYTQPTSTHTPTIGTITPNADGSITVTGTAQPNSTVTVIFPDNTSAIYQVNSTGQYSVKSGPGQTSGKVWAVDTDATGNSPAVSQQYTDNTAPLPPVLGTIVSNADGSITVIGTAEPNSTVVVKFPDNASAAVTVGASGAFSVSSAQGKAEPAGNVSAIATDQANHSSTAASVAYTLASSNTPVPVIGSITPNDDGSITVAGRAEANSSVTVIFPDNTSRTVPVGPSGAYSVTSGPGQTSGKVMVVDTDANGHSTAAISQYTDTTPPQTPVFPPNNITTHADGSITVIGTAEPNSTVTVKLPDGTTQQVKADANGNFSVSSAPGVVEKDGTITVTATDQAGNTSPTPATENYTRPPPNPHPVTIDHITPNPDGSITVTGTAGAHSTVTITFPDGSKAIYQVGTTANGTNPTYSVTSAPGQNSGTVSAVDTDSTGSGTTVTQQYTDNTPPLPPVLNPAIANADGSITVTGRTEPNSTVVVKFPDGTSVAATVSANGAFTASSAANVKEPAGPVSAIATDRAHNDSQPASESYTPASTTTPVPIIGGIVANSNGSITVNGTAEANSTVTVFFPDGRSATYAVGANGQYSVTSAAGQTSGKVLVTDTDAAGTSPAISQTYTDTTPPQAPVLNPIIITHDDGSITVIGTAEPNSTVVVKFPDNTSSAAVTVGANGAFSVSSAPGVSEPNGTVSAIATDQAGNQSQSSSEPYSLPSNTPPPTIGSITGNPDGSITVAGTAEPGSTVTVVFPDNTTKSDTVGANGQYSISSGPGQTTGQVTVVEKDSSGTSTPVTETYTDNTPPATPGTPNIVTNADGSITVSGTAEPNSTVTVTFPDNTTAKATVGADGKYSVSSAAGTAQQPGNVVVTDTDQAGNSSQTQTPYPPGGPITQPFIDGVTANPDGSITITGTATPGYVVTATMGTAANAPTLGSATVDATGHYTIDSGPGQTSGTVSVSQTDSNGLKSGGAVFRYADTTPPAQPTGTITTKADGSITVAGTGEVNSTIKVLFPDGTSATAVVGANGQYSVSSAAGKAQTGNVTITDTDQANNASPSLQLPIPNPLVAPPTITNISANPDGSITVTGRSEVGGTVTVTFPDHSSKTYVVGSNGLFTVQSAPGQTTGPVLATNTNTNGTSTAATSQYTDSTPPLAPTLNPLILTNADGSIIVSGTAEPHSTVKVTFPDGASATFTVGANGLFSVTSPANEKAGQVTVTATDQASHTSPSVTEQYTLPTGTHTPTIGPITANPDGSITVTGTAQPNSTVTVIFPDNSSKSASVGLSGAYAVQSGPGQTSGKVLVVDTDATGTSQAASQQYTDNTPPQAPVLGNIVTNADGSITVIGTAEPNSTVVVKFPDNTSAAVTVGASGTFSVSSALGVKESAGQVSAIATDQANNASTAASGTYTPPPPNTHVPVIGTITPNNDGSITVAGTADAGSTVTVIFPDNTSKTVPVGPSGTYSVTSGPGQTSGKVLAVETDASGTSTATASQYTDNTPPQAPVFPANNITTHADGSITVVGTAEPNSTVTVKLPDGTTQQVKADANGNFSVSSAPGVKELEGDITATATDQAGNASTTGASEHYTPPPNGGQQPHTPTITAITPNPDGSITVTGTAVANSAVTVTFPDGATAIYQVGNTPNGGVGSYIVTSAPGQTTGTVSVIDTNNTGASPAVTQTYTDNTPPLPPVLNPAFANADGSITVTGRAEPNSVVKVTFPDNTQASFTVTANGTFTVTSAANEQAGTISAIATDKAGNSSASVSENYPVPPPGSTAPTITGVTTASANDGSITVTGTAPVAGTVIVTFPDGLSAVATVSTAGGGFTVTSGPGQTSGTVWAAETTSAGTSPAARFTYTDNTPPQKPVLNPAIITNADGSITVIGTAEPHSTVTVTFPDSTTGKFTVGANGAFSISSTPGKVEGAGTVSAIATDQAGNASQSASEHYDLPTTPPPTIGNITANPDGSITVAGTAPAGSTVTVVFPDSTTKNFTVGADGQYTVTSSPGQTSGTVTVMDRDASGHSSEAVTQTYTDNTPPAQPPVPTIVTNADGSITVSGTAEPNSTVTVTFPDKTTATVPVGTDGKYSVSSAAGQQTGTVSVVDTDQAGNHSPSRDVPVTITPPPPPASLTIDQPTANSDGSVTVVVHGTAGDSVTVTFPNTGDTKTVTIGAAGTISVTSAVGETSGNITAKDNTSGVTATITYTDNTPPLQTSSTVKLNADGSITVTVTAEANSTVKVVFPGGSSATAVVDAAGDPVTLNSATGLTLGTNPTVTITATDKANHTSPVETKNVPITPPPQPSIDITANADGSITVSGTGQAGDSIKVVFPDGTSLVATADATTGNYSVHSGPGQTTGTVTVTDTNAAGSTPATKTYTDSFPPAKPVISGVTENPDGSITVSGTAEPNSTVKVVYPDGTSSVFTVGANGQYSVSSAAGKPEPVGDITVTATDQANNTSQATTQHFDPHPTGPINLTAIVQDTGEFANDFITNDNSLVFVGTLQAALAAGQSAQININGTWVNITNVSGTNWTYSNTGTLADNSYNVQVRIVDSTGTLVPNTLASQTVIVDTAVPAEVITIGSVTSASITGTVGALIATNGASGSLEYVEVSIDGGRTWNSASVNGTTWTYTPANPLQNGTYTVEARVVDVAGNTGTPAILANAPITGVTPPPINITAIAPDTGVSSSDFITDTGRLVFIGTLGSALTGGQQAQININGTWVNITSVNGTSWQYDATGTNLADGNYIVQVRVGTAGAVSSQIVVVDTTAPTASISITSISASTAPGTFTTSDGQLVLSGKLGTALSTGEYVQVSFDGGAHWVNAAVNGTTWSYDNSANPFNNGTYTVEARVVDIAGNVGNTAVQPVIIQGAPPVTISINSIVPDSGDSNSDFITNTGNVTIYGTLGSALTGTQTVQISLDGGKNWLGVTAVSGTSWSYGGPGTFTTDGSYVVEARVVPIGTSNTPIGNVASQTVVIDTTAPVETLTIAGYVVGAGSNTLVFDGSLSQLLGPNESVQFSSDGGATWHNAQVNGTTWSYISSLLPNGNYTVEARVADVAGNYGTVVTKSISVTAPAPTISISAIAPDSGESSSDFITNTGNVTLFGTLGSAIAAGQTAQVSLDGGKTWNSVTVDGTGLGWSYVGTFANDGSYLVEARVVNTGSTTPIGVVASQTVVIDTTAPTEGISILGISQATVSQWVTADDTLVFYGTLSQLLGPNEYVQFSTDGGRTWQNAAVNGSTWSFDNTAHSLVNGSYLVEARVIDVAGNIGQVASQTITIQGAPIPSISISAVTPDTAPSGTPAGSPLYSDFITDVNHLTFTGLLSTALAPGQSVQISLNGGQSWQAATIAAGNPLRWTFDNTANTIADGVYTIEARIVTGTGASATQVPGTTLATQQLTVDTTAPSATIAITGLSVDTPPVGDWTTTDSTLIFNGTLSQLLGAGESVQFSLDGGTTWQNAAVSGTTWTFNNTANSLANGSYLVEARVVDTAGNVGSTAQQSITVTADSSTAPTITINAISPDDGASATDFITDKGALTITGTVGQPIGTGSAGVAVQVSLDGGRTWQPATVSGLTWTTSVTGLADGSYNILARVTDSSGNQVGTLQTRPLVIDTTAPTETITFGGIVGDTDGVDASGAFLTSDNTLLFYGTLSQPLNLTAGSSEYVQVSIDDGKTWFTATTNGTTWSFDNTAQPLADDTYKVQARVVDTAGNIGASVATGTVIISGGGYTPPATIITIGAITPDTAPPGTAAGSPLLSDFITDNSKVTFTGTFGRALLAGESVQVSVDGGVTWTNATWDNAKLTWSYAPLGVGGNGLADGTYTVEARINSPTTISGFVASQTVVIDTHAPTEVVGINGGANVSVSTSTPNLTGTLSSTLAGSTPTSSAEILQISLDNGATWTTVTVPAGSTTWSYTPTTPLAPGAYDIIVQAVDTAGNVDPSKATQHLVVNPPTNVLVNIVSVTPDTAPPGTPTGNALLSDFITDSSTVTINGTIGQGLTAGQQVQVSLDGGGTTPTSWVTLPASSVSGFSWSYQTGALADNTYQVVARIVDSNGNALPNATSNAQALVIDTHQPLEVITITGGASLTVATATPTISGTLSAALAGSTPTNTAESLQISLDGGNTWNAVPAANINGTSWSYTPALPLGNSTYTVEVRVVDVAGNFGTAASQSLTVNVPTGTQALTINSITPDTGTSSTDFVTNPYLGTGTGKVSFGGGLFEALTTGQNVQINVLDSTGKTVLGTGDGWTNATASGLTWSYDLPNVLPDGSYTVQARIITGSTPGTVATHAVVIDTKVPTETTQITGLTTSSGANADAGASATDFITDVNNFTIGGTLSQPLNSAGGSTETLQISTDGGKTWATVTNTTTGPSGTTWSYALTSALADGTYTVQTQVIDQAGNIGPTGSQVVTIDTRPPSEQISFDAKLPNATSDSTPWVTVITGSATTASVTIGGKLNTALATTTANGVSAESLQINLGDGTGWHAVTVTGTSWTYTTNLAAGTYNVQVEAIDLAGNTGNPVNLPAPLIVAPPNPGILAPITSISYTSPDGSTTVTNSTTFAANNNNITLNGSLSSALGANQQIQVSVDGGTTWNTVVPSSGISGTSWSVAVQLPTINGTNLVETRVHNNTTNTNDTVSSQSIGAYLLPPPQGVSITGITPDTGVAGDFQTNTGDITINGTVSGVALNSSTSNNPQYVKVSTDGGVTFNNATVTGSTWTYKVPATLANGTYHVVAEVADAVGNVGQTATHDVVISSLPPVAVATITGIDPDTGVAGDFITQGTQVTIKGAITGTLAAGDTVQVTINNGTAVNAVVSGNTWSYALATPTDGTYKVQAQVVSVTGVGSLAATHDVIIDNTAPTQTVTITAVTDGTTVTGGFLTPDQKITVSGTVSSALATGDTLEISIDGSNFAPVTVNADRTWTFDNTANTLTDGNHTVVLKVVDVAGNDGRTTSTVVQVQTTPKETVSAISNISPDTGATLSDGTYVTSTNGATPKGSLTVTGTISTALAANEGVQVSLDGTNWVKATVTGTSWTATINSVADGTKTITAEVYNTITGRASAPLTGAVLVDSTAPTEILHVTGIAGPAGVQGTLTRDTNGNIISFSTSAESGLTFSGTISSALQTLTTGHTAEALQISIDGGATWQNVTTFPTASTWSYTMPVSGDGSKLSTSAVGLQMRVVDGAGNIEPSSSALPDVTGGIPIIYQPPPPFQNLYYQIAAGYDDGASATDNITSIAAQKVTGSVVTNDADTRAAITAGKATALIYIDSNGNGIPDGADQLLGASTVAADGTFSVNLASLSPGSYNIQAALGINGIYSTTSASGVQMLNTAGTALGSNKLTIVVNQPAETLTQPTQSLGLGYSMSAIGDFNGDGYTDYIVSAPRDLYGPSGGTTATVQYLLYGSASGLANVGNLADLTPAQGIKITSTNSGDNGIQGLTVTDVGDLNGDGLSDVAISSNLNDRTYVLFGTRNSSGAINLNTLETGGSAAGTAGFVIKSNGGGNYVGTSATGADINGDGYSDLIFSAPNSGTTYVIYGHAGSWSNYNAVGGNSASNSNLVYTTASGGNGATASGVTKITVGTNGNTWLGGTVTTVGDVNGDGNIDYVITAPTTGPSNTAGTAYLIFGTAGGTMPAALNLANLSPTQGITLTSSQAGERLGGQTQNGGAGQQGGAAYAQYHSVTSLGDINGDGYTDFAIGSPGAIKPTGTNDGAGAVYVLYGTAAGVNWSSIALPSYSGSAFSNSLAGKGFVIYSSTFAQKANASTNTASDLGYSVSTVGDVNGDGVDDFMIGAPEANNGAGAAFLVFGQAGTGLPGAATGVVNLDTLVTAGKAAVFGTPGTAIEYDGTSGGGTSARYTNTYVGTDVTGGDYTGTGLSSYSYSAWNQGNNSGSNTLTNNGQGYVYTYNGTTAYLTQSYTTGDDILYAGVQGIGNATITTGNRLTGGQGNDWIHGIGVALDVAYGGQGNDSIGIVSTTFQRVDGGSGWDTLVFESSGLNLNLATMGAKVQNFEAFDLNNSTHTAATDPQGKFTAPTTGNTLQLRLSDVLDLVQEVNNANATTTTATQQRVTIYGDTSSTVILDNSASLGASNWSVSGSQTINGKVFGIYHDNLMGANTSADLLIQQGVNVL